MRAAWVQIIENASNIRPAGLPSRGSRVECPVSRNRRGHAGVVAGQVTGLLRAWNHGDQDALEQLIPLVEAELRRVARAYMARELRFFGGLNVEETAEVLHLSTDTVKRDWRMAKLWLLHELEGDTR
jgi:hypothetical protein